MNRGASEHKYFTTFNSFIFHIRLIYIKLNDMLIEKECIFCHNKFMADSREIKRGNAKYCNLSCSAKDRIKNRPLKQCKCVVCDTLFKSIYSKAKYCCKKCKYKHYRQLVSTSENGTYKLQKILLTLPCANCGWDLSSRDIHHIIPVSKGGKNEMKNLITLCPNCHRMSHRNLLSKDKLQKLVYLRTISSSCINNT